MEKKEIVRIVLVSTLTFIMGGLFAYSFFGGSFFNPTEKTIPGQICSDIAKVCPDGSFVTQTGPNCEFAQCPPDSGANKPFPVGAPEHPKKKSGCVDQCGDGKCSEITCSSTSCPCSETQESCPSDCATDKYTVPGEYSVMCTKDAKVCSDGSYVSRTGPNCEFMPCPVE